LLKFEHSKQKKNKKKSPKTLFCTVSHKPTPNIMV